MTDESAARPAADGTAPAPRRRARWAALYFALLLAVVLGGVGSAPYWAPPLLPLLPWGQAAKPPTEAYSRLAARVGAIEAGSRAAAAAAAGASQQNDQAIAAAAAHLRTLDKRITALEAKESAAPAVDPAQIEAMRKELGRLAERLAGFEKTPASPGTAAPPQAALDKIEQQIAANEGRSQSRAEQLRDEIAKLKAEETRLDALTAGLADRVPAIAAELHARRAADNSDAALFLGLLQLRDAFAEARPFTQEYKTFLTMVGNRPDLAEAAKPLAAAAKSGVASRVALLHGLAELAGRIAAKKPLPAKKDWRSRLAGEVASLVKIRRIDENGAPAPQAAINAAQLALAHGDLAGAVKALEPLSGTAAEAARPWLDQARQRLAAEAAFAHLQDVMVRELVGGSTPAAPSRDTPPPTPKKPGAPS